MTTTPETMPEAPPRLTRIDGLMKNLEDLAYGAGGMIESRQRDTARDARQLICDLLGMSDLPLGERIYDRAMQRIYAEHSGELTGSADELRAAMLFARAWKRDIWPASDEGQVPFGRAIFEHMEDAVQRHLDAEHKS